MYLRAGLGRNHVPGRASLKNIVIADDHPIVRQGLRKIFSECGGYSVVAEASSAPELKSVLRAHHVDVLILDISIPGGGLDALRETKQDYPMLPVLIFSLLPEMHFGLRAYKEGAAGYLSKRSTAEELVSAVQTIVAGRPCFTKITEDLIFAQLQKKADANLPPHHHLSNRELHVFTSLGQGVSLTQISTDLSLSVKTISTYRQRVLSKMQMTTNAQIVKYIVTHGLDPMI